MIQTDRLSAFDVILDDPIPGKGEVLTAMSNFWFGKLGHLIPNHMTGIDPEIGGAGRGERAQVRGRAMVVRVQAADDRGRSCAATSSARAGRTTRQSGPCAASRCRRACARREKLPQTIFTPSTKAPAGTTTRTSPSPRPESAIGTERARQVRDASIASTPGARRVRRDARHHHRRHQVRVRARRAGSPVPDRRGAHVRLLALLAGWRPGARGRAPRASTSNTCATGSTASASSASRPPPRCRPKWRAGPRRSTWRP